jgi:hypothetical protein
MLQQGYLLPRQALQPVSYVSPHTPLPEHRDGVRRKFRIVRHQGQAFLVSLGDEESVEG